MTSTLRSLGVKISFESETLPIEINSNVTDDLENIRQIQGKINEIITEKMKNKSVEDEEDEEDLVCEVEEDIDSEDD